MTRSETDAAMSRVTARHQRTIQTLQSLVVDLSDGLTDEGGDWSNVGLHSLRKRVANAIPLMQCPDWLHEYRDPPVVQS